MHKTLQSRIIEAALFTADKPLGIAELQNLLPPQTSSNEVMALLAELQQTYQYRGVHLRNIAAGWIFASAEDLAPYLRSYAENKKKISRAALEVLAIIAYHQPITRSEIEDLRGVSLSRGTLDLLLQIGWVKPRGKRHTPGQPTNWGITPEFLKHFGLNKVEDLPGLEELRSTGLTSQQRQLNIISMEEEKSE